jgi:hypothetical protein
MSRSKKPLFDTDQIEMVLRRAKHDQWRTTGELVAGARSNVSRSLMRVGRRNAPFVAAVLVVLT